MRILCPNCGASIKSEWLNYGGCDICCPDLGSEIAIETPLIQEQQSVHRKPREHWFAYDPVDNNFRTFETEELAKEWLETVIQGYLDDDDGYSPEFIRGEGVVGKITQKTHFTVTQRKKDFCDKACDVCKETYGVCGKEPGPWPYGPECQEVGTVGLKEVSDPDISVKGIL